ncbi:transcriptional regulator, LuxR family [Chitinophaga sp. YR573]|uniref:helix-turn-helix transcriptional regulator n=1 Tax=Chitinophaga sp. YR573 TaxID=1881040 RepID=UPI0008BBAD39|nr:helix-turn-helix transcriptional regulator [Chitinophaga sp. YR573]SEV95967.1 transcriptional regulator, LuxR family [Chitinophaga sp. YR573]
MELIERTGFLALIQSKFKNVNNGEGHCILVTGEPGIGKTSLVKAFCNEIKLKYKVYQGTCDALFTPRPLAPLYDILLQLSGDIAAFNGNIEDRTTLFFSVLQLLQEPKFPTVLIFEDIHWADEATLDFIKFLSRRISQLQCLFILTYRDDEVHSRHPLRNVLGQLSPQIYTRIQLLPFSRQAVEKLSREKGYSGEDVYSVSGGNPFYVSEILASYSGGVPDNIMDSILFVYNGLEDHTRHLWEVLSIFPAGFEIRYLKEMEPLYEEALKFCLEKKILIIRDRRIVFKHELYRRTIESTLPPLLRTNLNQKVLTIFLQIFEQNGEIERIIHHAQYADNDTLVVHYAPVAARQAASVGAHTEAARLYLTTLTYYQGKDTDTLIQFFENYAYECYLTNQIHEAIKYTEKAFVLLKDHQEKSGNCLRFLSRLWWLAGNRKNAESFSQASVELLQDLPSSTSKAMSFSNMSHLKMMLDQHAECIFWGKKAIAIAEELHDEETLSHALNNVGSVEVFIKSSHQHGWELLQKSLDIALKNSFHEHAARAYSNLASTGIKMKDYAFTREILETGIAYCEKRDLDLWRSNMLSWKALMHLETADWDYALMIANNLLKNDIQPASFAITSLLIVAKISMRKGKPDSLSLLIEAKKKAFETTQLQWILPTVIALLEYEWITGEVILSKEELDQVKSSIFEVENAEFALWMHKARKQQVALPEIHEGYQINNPYAANLWEKSGATYLQAMILFEGDEDSKKNALKIIQALDAKAVYEKMKYEMKKSGIRYIPRGIRKTTQSNPCQLTDRELDVLVLLNKGLTNREIADTLFISAKTVDHHISSILFKLDAKSRAKAVQEAIRLDILK